jgi:hypothetical protein
MRVELRHPKTPGLVAHYGWDPALSWWVEVQTSGRYLVEYDGLTCGSPTSPAGILQVFIEQAFFSEDDIHEAKGWLAEIDELDEIDDPGARRAAEVIMNLKKAGGSG